MYSYNTETDTLTERTPDSELVQLTAGIRSAGALDGVAILAGPRLSLEGGINLFAFDSDSGEFLGATTLEAYSNIRKWVVHEGVLYTAVGLNEPPVLPQGAGEDSNGTVLGKVLRWTGSKADPFQFEVVGDLDSSGAELVVHEGRLFVSTWPGRELTGERALAGLWMSPVIPEGGLTQTHTQDWQKVWEVDAYEPDPLIAATYGGGALASFDGYLYWGTMHVPFVSTRAFINFYGPPADEAELIEMIFGTYRNISIFRGRNFADAPEVELLYGMPMLPVYTEGVGWEMQPNNMETTTPRYGLSGFGNFFNNYTWAMGIAADQLLVGTMDWSFLFEEVLAYFFIVELGHPPTRDLQFPGVVWGADLWRFPDSGSPAVAESVDGLGNYLNYGVRNVLTEGAFYLGTANPMNLMTDPEDELPEGGWELLRMDRDPWPDIRVNGSDGPVFVPHPDRVSVEISLNPGTYRGAPAQWWVVAETPFGWFSYVKELVYPFFEGWVSGTEKMFTMELGAMEPFEVLNSPLPLGAYNLYFAVEELEGEEPVVTWVDEVQLFVE